MEVIWGWVARFAGGVGEGGFETWEEKNKDEIWKEEK